MRNIAVLFELDENWVGGSYYIKNLVSALTLLTQENQPFITLISEKPESVRFIKDIGYPHVGWIRKSNYDANPKKYPFDVFFPHPTGGNEKLTVSWIPDFQELHLTYFFTEDEIKRRRGHHRNRFATAGLVVSSNDVAQDVHRFYPGECQNTAVVRFASFNEVDESRIADVRVKYDLPKKYVICANQIWVHKNHIVALHAVALLKQEGIDLMLAFTGNENDYRVSGYTAFLKQLAQEWGIIDNIRFLGFIPRDDQLCLMKGAHYVLQPSLFEGWSTVIEDAKSMGQFVVASDLNVHKEQLNECCRFFFRHDPQSLADIMKELDGIAELPARSTDYKDARRRFGQDFMFAINKFCPVDPEKSIETIAAHEMLLSEARDNMLSLDNLPLSSLSAPKSSDQDLNVEQDRSTHMKCGAVLIPPRLMISTDHSQEAYKSFIIYTKEPINLIRAYKKFMIKVLFMTGRYFVEVKSSSIDPDILDATTAQGKDENGYFLRTNLTHEKESNTFKTRVVGFSDDTVYELNLVLDIGIKLLFERYEKESIEAPDFWERLRGGIAVSNT